MKKLLKKLGFIKKEITVDEYIISIRPKKRQLSTVLVSVNPPNKNNGNNKDNGLEDAGCLVIA